MKIRSNALFLMAGALGFFLSPAFAGSDPFLPENQINQLKDFPESLNHHESLMVRHKHLRSVQFLGNGIQSEYGYVKNNGLIRHGLWLRVKNEGRENWASASVIFNPPIKAHRYNSIALWVRPLSPGFQFWVEAQDADWTEFSSLQARTNVLPGGDFPPDKPFLVVIPYSQIFQETPLQFEKLSRLRFEFGSGTAGNEKGAAMEILGIGFINQKEPLEDVVVRPRLPRRNAVASLKRRLRNPSLPISDERDAEAPRAFSAAFYGPGAEGVPVKFSPSLGSRDMASLTESLAYPILKRVEKQGEPWFLVWVEEGRRGWVSENQLMNSKPPVKFFLSRKVTQAPFPAPEISPKEEPADEPATENFVKRSHKHWMNLGRLFKRTKPVKSAPPETVEQAEAGPPFWTPQKIKTASILLGSLGVLSLLGLVIFQLLKRKPWMDTPHAEKIWHAIQWPFKTPENQWEARSEEIFWKNQAERGVRFATLSCDGLSLSRLPSDLIIGEAFLKRQAGLAKKEKIELAPSLCFVRTLFHMDSFFATPSLYFWQAVPQSESHLSDEELRRKYLGYFPLWTPPFWQKKHHLPQRLLVAYGKMMGSVFASDSVQFDLLSPDLRKMAIKLLKGLAKTASAVRIESAASLLNSTLKYYMAQNQTGQLPETEFWKEVIGAVKKDHPSFQVIADGQGLKTEELLQVGFDFVENEKVRQSLHESLESENSTTFITEMRYQQPPVLQKSLYRIEGAWETGGTFLTRRNRLAAALAAFLPGKLIVEGPGWADVKTFTQTMEKWPAMKTGFYRLLTGSSPQVLGLARWSDKSLILALFNLSRFPVESRVGLDNLKRLLPDRNLTLFHDVLFGEPGLWDLREDGAPRPAVAVSTAELQDNGLPVRLPGLSLKVFSVNLSRSIFSDSKRSAALAAAPPSTSSS